MRWSSQTPKSIPLAPDTKEKDPTHLLQMLTQTLPFTNPSVHTSGACVDQQVDGQMNGWTAAPACLPLFLPFLPSQFTPLSWDPMLGFKLPMVVIKAPTRILPRFAAMTFNTSGMIRNLRTDCGRLCWAPDVRASPYFPAWALALREGAGSLSPDQRVGRQRRADQAAAGASRMAQQ